MSKNIAANWQQGSWKPPALVRGSGDGRLLNSLPARFKPLLMDDGLRTDYGSLPVINQFQDC